jgi:hypothetical protein
VAMSISSFQKSATQAQPKANPKFSGIGLVGYYTLDKYFAEMKDTLQKQQVQIDTLNRQLRQSPAYAYADNSYGVSQPIIKSNMTFK